MRGSEFPVSTFVSVTGRSIAQSVDHTRSKIAFSKADARDRVVDWSAAKDINNGMNYNRTPLPSSRAPELTVCENRLRYSTGLTPTFRRK
jgi:hypothetical protein